MRLVNLDKRRPSCSLSLYIYVWVIFFLFNLLPFTFYKKGWYVLFVVTFNFLSHRQFYGFLVFTDVILVVYL